MDAEVPVGHGHNFFAFGGVAQKPFHTSARNYFRVLTTGARRGSAAESPRRTVVELMAAADNRREADPTREGPTCRRGNAHREWLAAAVRERHLNPVAGRVEQHWAEIEALIATKQVERGGNRQSIQFQIPIAFLRMDFASEFNMRRFRDSRDKFALQRVAIGELV